MAKNQMANILARSDKDVGGTSGANGVLSRLFRKMLIQMNINENRWNLLMHAFTHDPRNGVAQTRKDQTSMRGNITKEFSRPQMTWKVFCKAMMFMQFVWFEVGIRARMRNGKEIWFSTEVNLGDRVSPAIEIPPGTSDAIVVNDMSPVNHPGTVYTELQQQAEKIETLFEVIKPAVNEADQAWLKQAVANHFAGLPIPPRPDLH